MNDYLLSLVLGVVEGLTEFLPVSSTAHLRIAQALLGVDLEDGYWKMFSVVIQLGAILCLPIFFWRRILSFLSTFPKGRRGDKTVLTHPLTLTLIAFLVTAAPSYLVDKTIGKNLENLTLMAIALIVGGIVMWVVDVRYGSDVGGTFEGEAADEVDDTTFSQAVWIGIGQFISAAIPGTSRSMATISAGQITGFSRTAALEFSFLLSIPTMAVATGYKLLRYLKPHAGEPVPHLDTHAWIVLAIGFFVSFVVAWAVVAWFMHWVRRKGFVPFAIYRLLAGGALLLWMGVGGR